jgi:hypothetical protein
VPSRDNAKAAGERCRDPNKPTHVAPVPQLRKSLHTIVDASTDMMPGIASKQEQGEFTMRVDHQRGSKAGAILGVLCIAIALLWSSGTKAETHVYLLRGWFGVFSTGLDSLADELRSKGIKAEAVGHLAWKSTVSNIVKDRASGKSGPVVLVGHSQGANNVIEMARLLEREKIPVDLLVTLAPLLQDPVPGNVVRALNYYHSPGWGAPVIADAGFHGKLSNINLGGDIGVSHIAMDKSPKIQAEIERAILAVPQTR